ncbi:hypothetical protein PS623_01046 [Pseudomonas fluorescens]|nr:hypothetical protein PS623_01046 [Pseudomonas fluorescens]
MKCFYEALWSVSNTFGNPGCEGLACENKTPGKCRAFY